ncbi:MAG: EAL domain-containing protein [Cellulomonadaceae bacterium]|nr:EAL domain-containing protein [Cellulomonadaceae bacterium]
MTTSPPRIVRRRLTAGQMLLVVGLVVVVCATPLLTYLEYSGLTGTVDSFGMAQNVTGNLADAQRDALLTVIGVDRLTADPATVDDLLEQVGFLGQQLRVLDSGQYAADVEARVSAAVVAHADLEAELTTLQAVPDGELDAALTAARPDLTDDSGAVTASLSGLYSQFENSFYSSLSDQLRSRRDRQVLILGSAVLAVLIGLGLTQSLRRTIRKEFDDAYQLLRQEAADRAAAQAVAELSDRRFRALVQNSNDSILVLDADRRVTYANPSAAALLHGRGPELVGDDLGGVVAPQAVELAESVFTQSLGASGETVTVDLTLGVDTTDVGGDDEAIVIAVQLTNLLDDPAVAGIVVNAHDVTERTRHASQLEHLAYHDRVTGLPNRLSLERDLGRIAAQQQTATVVVIDLDGFGAVNERWGDATGDELLRGVARRLDPAFPGLTAYHLGGDEFALLGAVDCGQAETAALVASLRGLVTAPLALAATTLELTAGIGVAAASLATVRGHALLRHADSAMHEAKRQGPDRAVVLDEARARAAEELTVMTAQLALALERRELELHYQPIVRATDRTWVTVEALLRWNHPDGRVSPADFIPVAEGSGLIVPIGRWVLATAVRALPGLRAATGLPLQVNVNVAASQLQDPGFLAHARASLDEAGLEPGALVLELTESAVLEDPDRAVAVLTAARDAGMHVALDDFGTGYSSLSYLLRLPVSSVKLDRSFLHDVSTSPRTRRLLASLVEISHDMGLRVTVEGVETEETMAAVIAAGCDTVQGFLVARPAPVDDVIRLGSAARAAAEPVRAG